MRVLSLFDGLGGTFLALSLLGIIPTHYYSSEIDTYCLKVTSKLPVTQIGDVRNVSGYNYKNIDLLTFGFPCSNLSCVPMKENQTGLDGIKSSLFYEGVRILRECSPKYFLVENVASMTQLNKDRITELLGVNPILINSKIFTAQNRSRLYWTNFRVPEPREDPLKSPSFSDILCTVEEAKELELSQTAYDFMHKEFRNGKNRLQIHITGDTDKQKTPCLITNKSHPSNCVIDRRFNPYILRKYSLFEMEALQGVKSEHTECVSYKQRKKMLGNSFNIPTISYILSGILTEW